MFALSLFMQTLLLPLRPGAARERGASLVEYAILVALIAVVCIAAVAFFGGETNQKFSRVGNSITAA